MFSISVVVVVFRFWFCAAAPTSFRRRCHLQPLRARSLPEWLSSAIVFFLPFGFSVVRSYARVCAHVVRFIQSHLLSTIHANIHSIAFKCSHTLCAGKVYSSRGATQYSKCIFYTLVLLCVFGVAFISLAAHGLTMYSGGANHAALAPTFGRWSTHVSGDWGRCGRAEL